MTVSRFVQPNYTTQTAAQYKANIDAALAALVQNAGIFAPHQVYTGSPNPDLAVELDAGYVWNGATLVSVAAQQVGGITIPSAGQNRVDRIVVNTTTGVAQLVTGTPVTGSPQASAPSIPAGTMPICQVYIDSADTAVFDSMITDERAFLTSTGPATTTVPRLLQNVGLSVAMAASAVTIALKGADGNDPSSSNAVKVGFRNATLTSGAASEVSVTGALSTVISSGSTGGTVSAQASRIWVGAILVSGAVELAWFNALSGTNIAPINEGGVITTTAEGGAGGADTAQTWYSTTARTAVPVTILGYFDSNQTTAGTWAAAADVVVVNPKYRPCDVIQTLTNVDGAVATGTTAMPQDDTIPQNTEGDQYLATTSMSPVSAANVLVVDVMARYLTNPSVEFLTGGLFRDATAGAVAAVTQRLVNVNDYPMSMGILHRALAASVSATQFKYRIGGQSSSTTTFNGAAGSRLLGGVLNSYATISEIVA